MFDSYLDRRSLTPDGEPIISRSSRLLPVLWNGKPAMLKMPRDAAERAGGALMHWGGEGAAKVYAHDGEAVLLERATGGRSLLKMA
jgi:streptomycin 6-kinase